MWAPEPVVREFPQGFAGLGFVSRLVCFFVMGLGFRAVCIDFHWSDNTTLLKNTSIAQEPRSPREQTEWPNPKKRLHVLM